MKEQILTAYGPVTIDVRRIVGSRIFVAHERHIFPAGTKTRGGEVLKKDFVVPLGAVFVPVWEDFEGNDPALLHRIFVGGIYEALRGVTHAIRKYGLVQDPGEIQLLRHVSDRLAANLSVLMHGKLASRRELAKVKRDLARLAIRLGQPTDEKKAQATKKIAAASKLEVRHPSGTRSQNLPATKNRLDAAKRRIDGRLDCIYRIGPRIGFFEQTLAQAIGRLFDDLESLRSDLEKERRYIKMAFSQKIRDIFSERTDAVLERLLPHLDAEPFLKTAKMIRVDLAKARAARSKNFALDAIDRILTAVRIKRAQRLLEQEVILPFALKCNLNVVTADDFGDTRARLGNFAYYFIREIKDTNFVRPVRPKVSAAVRAILNEEFGDKPDATRLKERLKAVSRMF